MSSLIAVETLDSILEQEIDVHKALYDAPDDGKCVGLHPAFKSGFIAGLEHIKKNILPIINKPVENVSVRHD